MPKPDEAQLGPRESESETVQERTFLAAPSQDNLRPSPKESHLLRKLWDWRERSADSQREWGKPLVV
jgi:hypothetical protein